MNICIFCSAYVLDKKYTEPAKELAGLLAKAGHNLVWGGSDVGIMNVVADAFQGNGGKLYGVSLEAYKHKMRQQADEMVVAKDLGTRKAAMLSKSDVILVLPGGIGTLDEVTDVLELRKQGHHDKPIIILNTDNFYGGLRQQLNQMANEGFIPLPLDKLIMFAATPNEVLKQIPKI